MKINLFVKIIKRCCWFKKKIYDPGDFKINTPLILILLSVFLVIILRA